MKIVNPKATITTKISEGGVEELKHIERIARTCYKSEDKISDDLSSAKKMIANLILNGHEAMIEHSKLSVEFCVDRGVSHELVRHRLASFAQESTRYCNYSKDKFGGEITVINPLGGLVFQGDKYNKSSYDFIMNQLTQALDTGDTIPDSYNDEYNLAGFFYNWIDSILAAEKAYVELTKHLGVSPQMARSVLPNSTKTTIHITANYREWRAIFALRTAKPAHPQMREVMVPLLLELKEKIPVIFDDFGQNTYVGNRKTTYCIKDNTPLLKLADRDK